jgi:hypothetical protein
MKSRLMTIENAALCRRAATSGKPQNGCQSVLFGFIRFNSVFWEERLWRRVRGRGFLNGIQPGLQIHSKGDQHINYMKAKIIRTLGYGALLGATALLPACAFHPTPVAVQAVGPAPREEANNAQNGYLVVYSAWGLVNENKAPVDHHSRYTLMSEDGKMNRVIMNHVDRFDEGPIRVPLTAGTYKVSALSAHSGRVIVPVIIAPEQTTYVYLDGRTRPKLAADQQADLVKLPDGQVVGWAVSAKK